MDRRLTRRVGLALGSLALAAAALTTAAAPAAADPEHQAPKGFVALQDIDPTIVQDIRYATGHNFVGQPIDGYREGLCILTAPAAKALHEAQRKLVPQGYTLKVYDCYRPQRAVNHFVDWARDLSDQRMKKEFYPRVDKSRLFTDGYIAEKSGHSRGSAVDVTLVPLPARRTPPRAAAGPPAPCYAPVSQRFWDDSVDMGTGFDCFDPLSHTLAPRIQGAQRASRLLLKSTLESVGFVNLPEEWWHFTYRQEPYPHTYFDFPVSRASLPPHLLASSSSK
ncbi:D-alanyl-D-alanine dipeptidase [Streptomyces spinoverrucosus]|uniref:D-alanyl-D-alanine dipeptidase n=1 Tax=Streptomyces spinoverrucosus TaxID=284043 RepID=A0A4Y3VU49_9ACTN|nr:M15 family metallopeptidase [Streptomyces spinoverrucosus]GEC10502.1 D-alanyl-D-alanine dipeptidase [Streptomyces spinoverrucosus]GHB96263.1 D-alanyl-D-alanine dipeptidase [Streptomyces spinoverrucosus]